MPVLPKSSTHANQSSKFLVLAWSPQFYRVASPTSFGNVMYCNYCHLFRLASNTNKQGGKNNHQVSHTTLTFLEFLWWLPYLQRQLAWAAAACERHTAKTHSQSAWANLLTKFVAKSNTTTICMPYNMCICKERFQEQLCTFGVRNESNSAETDWSDTWRKLTSTKCAQSSWHQLQIFRCFWLVMRSYDWSDTWRKLTSTKPVRSYFSSSSWCFSRFLPFLVGFCHATLHHSDPCPWGQASHPPDLNGSKIQARIFRVTLSMHQTQNVEHPEDFIRKATQEISENIGKETMKHQRLHPKGTWCPPQFVSIFSGARGATKRESESGSGNLRRNKCLFGCQRLQVSNTSPLFLMVQH